MRYTIKFLSGIKAYIVVDASIGFKCVACYDTKRECEKWILDRHASEME